MGPFIRRHRPSSEVAAKKDNCGMCSPSWALRHLWIPICRPRRHTNRTREASSPSHPSCPNLDTSILPTSCNRTTSLQPETRTALLQLARGSSMALPNNGGGGGGGAGRRWRRRLEAWGPALAVALALTWIGCGLVLAAHLSLLDRWHGPQPPYLSDTGAPLEAAPSLPTGAGSSSQRCSWRLCCLGMLCASLPPAVDLAVLLAVLQGGCPTCRCCPPGRCSSLPSSWG